MTYQTAACRNDYIASCIASEWAIRSSLALLRRADIGTRLPGFADFP
jgi:hypothetical protein